MDFPELRGENSRYILLWTNDGLDTSHSHLVSNFEVKMSQYADTKAVDLPDWHWGQSGRSIDLVQICGYFNFMSEKIKIVNFSSILGCCNYISCSSAVGKTHRKGSSCWYLDPWSIIMLVPFSHFISLQDLFWTYLLKWIWYFPVQRCSKAFILLVSSSIDVNHIPYFFLQDVPEHYFPIQWWRKALQGFILFVPWSIWVRRNQYFIFKIHSIAMEAKETVVWFSGIKWFMRNIK